MEGGAVGEIEGGGQDGEVISGFRREAGVRNHERSRHLARNLELIV